MLFLFFFHNRQVGWVGFGKYGKFNTFFLKASRSGFDLASVVISDGFSSVSTNKNEEKLKMTNHSPGDYLRQLLGWNSPGIFMPRCSFNMRQDNIFYCFQ